MAEALNALLNLHVNTTINALTAKIAVEEEENVALKAKVKRLTEEKVALEANVERFTGENVTMQDTVKFLTEKNARLSDELEDILKQKKAKVSSETPLNLKVDAYAAKMQVKAVQLSVDKMIKTLQTEVKNVKSKLTSIDEMKKSGAFEAQFANQETEPSEGDV